MIDAIINVDAWAVCVCVINDHVRDSYENTLHIKLLNRETSWCLCVCVRFFSICACFFIAIGYNQLSFTWTNQRLFGINTKCNHLYDIQVFFLQYNDVRIENDIELEIIFFSVKKAKKEKKMPSNDRHFCVNCAHQHINTCFVYE